MNETNHNPEDELAPLDSFEQQWIDQLAQREPELVQSEDAFVQSVMRANAEAHGAPAVLGRIGFSVLPYAVAAALLLAAFVGWSVLMQDPSEPSTADQLNNPTQPNDESVVTHNDKPKVELGKLIARVKSSATDPAKTLTTAVSEAPGALSVDRLFEVLGDSLPDLKEFFAPLESENEQSRA
ncbi:MAG: hypothetical protein AAGB26_06100 [Planctomycetota bacterium]